MIECLTILPKAASAAVFVCVCLVIHVESTPSLLPSPWVDKHNHHTLTEPNSALGDNRRLFYN